MAATVSIEDPMSSREAWILRLLYSPTSSDGNRDFSLYNGKRLMRALFLIDQKMTEHFNKQTEFAFEATKKGPIDDDVWSSIESLKSKNLLEVTSEKKHGAERRGDEFKLTKEGTEKARRYYNELTDDERCLIDWVRGDVASKSLGSFRSYVYSQYPEMTTDRLSD